MSSRSQILWPALLLAASPAKSLRAQIVRTAADPDGLRDTSNAYLYTRANPIIYIDPNGRASKQAEGSPVDSSEARVRNFANIAQKPMDKRNAPQAIALPPQIVPGIQYAWERSFDLEADRQGQKTAKIQERSGWLIGGPEASDIRFEPTISNADRVSLASDLTSSANPEHPTGQGSLLALVHTHPADPISSTGFSDSDLSKLVNSRQRISLVRAGNDRYFLALRTKQSDLLFRDPNNIIKLQTRYHEILSKKYKEIESNLHNNPGSLSPDTLRQSVPQEIRQGLSHVTLAHVIGKVSKSKAVAYTLSVIAREFHLVIYSGSASRLTRL